MIKELGNQAVHSARKVQPADALVATRELLHVCYGLVRTHGRRGRPDPGLSINPALPAKRASATPAVPPQTMEQSQKLQAQLAERDERRLTLLGTAASLDGPTGYSATMRATPCPRSASSIAGFRPARHGTARHGTARQTNLGRAASDRPT